MKPTYILRELCEIAVRERKRVSMMKSLRGEINFPLQNIFCKDLAHHGREFTNLGGLHNPQVTTQHTRSFSIRLDQHVLKCAKCTEMLNQRLLNVFVR